MLHSNDTRGQLQSHDMETVDHWQLQNFETVGHPLTSETDGLDHTVLDTVDTDDHSQLLDVDTPGHQESYDTEASDRKSCDIDTVDHLQLHDTDPHDTLFSENIDSHGHPQSHTGGSQAGHPVSAKDWEPAASQSPTTVSDNEQSCYLSTEDKQADTATEFCMSSYNEAVETPPVDMTGVDVTNSDVSGGDSMDAGMTRVDMAAEKTSAVGIGEMYITGVDAAGMTVTVAEAVEIDMAGVDRATTDVADVAALGMNMIGENATEIDMRGMGTPKIDTSGLDGPDEDTPVVGTPGAVGSVEEDVSESLDIPGMDKAELYIPEAETDAAQVDTATAETSLKEASLVHTTKVDAPLMDAPQEDTSAERSPEADTPVVESFNIQERAMAERDILGMESLEMDTLGSETSQADKAEVSISGLDASRVDIPDVDIQVVDIPGVDTSGVIMSEDTPEINTLEVSTPQVNILEVDPLEEDTSELDSLEADMQGVDSSAVDTTGEDTPAAVIPELGSSEAETSDTHSTAEAAAVPLYDTYLQHDSNTTEQPYLWSTFSLDAPPMYEDREFNFTKYPLRKTKSLKSSKTPPGTPRRQKVVRFADALGLDLESVRHILHLDSPPALPPSATSDLHLSDDVSSDRSTWMVTETFQQPGADPYFRERVQREMVVLENAVVVSRCVMGVVRVANVAYHKTVRVRFSMDCWASFQDMGATYMYNSNDGDTDRFTFNIQLPDSFVAGSRLALAISYSVNGVDYWDNNRGHNYSFECFARNMSSEDDKMWQDFDYFY